MRIKNVAFSNNCLLKSQREIGYIQQAFCWLGSRELEAWNSNSQALLQISRIQVDFVDRYM